MRRWEELYGVEAIRVKRGIASEAVEGTLQVLTTHKPLPNFPEKGTVRFAPAPSVCWTGCAGLEVQPEAKLQVARRAGAAGDPAERRRTRESQRRAAHGVM